MPSIADTGGFPLDPFADKAAGFIAADGPVVVGENAQIDPVQAKAAEGLFKDQIDGLATDAPSEVAFVEKTDGQPRATVVRIEMVQTRFADQRAVSFDHPSVGMFQQGAEPAVCLTLANHGLAVSNTTVHPDNL